MTRVVFVGEMFYSDLQVGGGPMPGGPGGAPPGYWGGSNPHPGQDLPGAQPGIDNSLPGQQPGVDNSLPGGRPPRPSQGLPPSGGTPTQPIYNPAQPSHPIHLPEGGTPLPGLPPPAGHENEVVVAVYKPGQGWTAKSYPVQPDQGQPQPGQLPTGATGQPRQPR
jgi:hypothetical protein